MANASKSTKPVGSNAKNVKAAGRVGAKPGMNAAIEAEVGRTKADNAKQAKAPVRAGTNAGQMKTQGPKGLVKAPVNVTRKTGKVFTQTRAVTEQRARAGMSTRKGKK